MDQARTLPILIVDDSKTMRHVLKTHLSGTGFDVVEAESGRQALEVLEQRPVALVISDIRMEDIDGIELVREIRKREKLGNRVAVILISSDLEPATRARGFLAGADEFLGKPLDPAELRRLVREMA